MPDYRAPGSYVEEVAYRAKAIEGAPTSTAAFVGPALTGPLAVEAPPPLILSGADFDLHFGGQGDLAVDGVPAPNHLARAAHAFFAEGGRRLYIARTPDGPVLADYQAALDALLPIAEISVVAAPGAPGVNIALIAHAETAGAYRFAVLDPPPDLDIAGVRAFRADYDSAQAALYYPWIIGADGVAVPPSGAVCGLYARTDAERGVWKAPANEKLLAAAGLQRAVKTAEQDVLNPEGVNCIRQFDKPRGIRVWGARTLSSDPELKYVSTVRYRNYLTASLERGLVWTVFEPNAEQLWANVQRVVSDFLFNEWQSGALLGEKPEQAYFVRCDRSTMTQNDLDNGRLVCMIGVAQLKPAEYVILRIGQMTADARQP